MNIFSAAVNKIASLMGRTPSKRGACEPYKPKPRPSVLSSLRALTDREKAIRRNAKVSTRQVVRRRMFERLFGNITLTYGGELRRNRRRIARSMAAREWERLHAA